MYVLKFKDGHKQRLYNPAKKEWEDIDIGNRYLSYMPTLSILTNALGPSTDNLEEAHFFHTAQEAKSNWHSSACDVLKVKLEVENDNP